MKLEKQLSKNEEYVIKWFEENGIEVISAKQYVSKTKFKIRKDGIEDDFELSSEITNIKKYMEMYKQSLDIKFEIEKAKREVERIYSIVIMTFYWVENQSDLTDYARVGITIELTHGMKEQLCRFFGKDVETTEDYEYSRIVTRAIDILTEIKRMRDNV